MGLDEPFRNKKQALAAIDEAVFLYNTNEKRAVGLHKPAYLFQNLALSMYHIISCGMASRMPQ
jgi:hypothetical protein